VVTPSVAAPGVTHPSDATASACCLYVGSIDNLAGMHLWRGEYSPFIRYAQMEFCYRVIVVPLSTFHRLAELIGDPDGELIFLFNTTRCGSTLLTQVHLCSIHV